MARDRHGCEEQTVDVGQEASTASTPVGLKSLEADFRNRRLKASLAELP